MNKTQGQLEQDVINRIHNNYNWISVLVKLPPEHVIVKAKDISGRCHRAFRVGEHWFPPSPLSVVTHWQQEDVDFWEDLNPKTTTNNDKAILRYAFWKLFLLGLLIAIFIVAPILFLMKG